MVELSPETGRPSPRADASTSEVTGTGHAASSRRPPVSGLRVFAIDDERFTDEQLKLMHERIDEHADCPPGCPEIPNMLSDLQAFGRVRGCLN